tara:strand:- start:72 stop:641 length:570 start_codon:yes stop_codon:yes gene_type:complete
MSKTQIVSGGITDGTIATADIADDAVTAAKATGFGKVAQIVQTVKTDTFSSSPSSFSDITGMSVSITPSATSSKIFVTARLSYGGDTNTYSHIRLVRGSTDILLGDAGETSQTRASFPASTGNDPDQYKCYNAVLEHLDSPSSSSSTTYKLQLYVHGSAVFYLNRPDNNSTNDYIGRYTSSITAMEILA